MPMIDLQERVQKAIHQELGGDERCNHAQRQPDCRRIVHRVWQEIAAHGAEQQQAMKRESKGKLD